MPQAQNDVGLSAQLHEVQARLAALRAEYEALGERILAEVAVETRLKDVITRQRLEAAQAGSTALDWPYLLEEGQGPEHYKLCNQALADLGLSGSGYYPETMQRAVRITMHQHQAGQVELLGASLKLVMPHIKPMNDGYGYVGIFERSLSEFGSYLLRFLPDQSTFECIRRRYGSVSVLKTSSDLYEVLAYIQANHYYE